MQSAEWIPEVWQHHPEHDDIEGSQLRREAVDVTVVGLGFRAQDAVGIPIRVLDPIDMLPEVAHKLLGIEIRVREGYAVPVPAIAEIE